MSLIEEKYVTRMQCVFDLQEKTEEYFGDEYKERISLTSVDGYINGKRIWFTPALNEGYLIGIRASAEDEATLDIIKPFISEIMGNNEPIFKFDELITFISYKKINDESDDEYEEIEETRMCPTIEWFILEPEIAISSLINNPEIENLELLNGKSISDYEEKGQAFTLIKKQKDN